MFLFLSHFVFVFVSLLLLFLLQLQLGQSFELASCISNVSLAKMPHNKVGFTWRLLTLLLLLLLLLLVVVQGGQATPTTPTAAASAAAPAVAQVIGATSLAATRAAVYAATDNHDDGDGDDNKRNQLEDLMPANLLLEDLQQPNGQLINLTRHHDGDIFYTNGEYTYSYICIWCTPNPSIRRSAIGGFLT